MQNKTILLSITGIVIITIGFLFFLRPTEAKNEFVRSLDATPDVFERKYIKVKDFNRIELTDPIEVTNPMTIKIVDDKFYVSDFSDFTIYKYNVAGEQVRKIETGRGKGPGEFTNLTAYDIIDNTLWAVDSQNLRISSFDVETGEFITSFPVDRRPIRIACLQDGFIVQWFGTDQLFSKFDYNGNELNTFGEIIENQQQQVATLDGKIVSNKENRFVYIPYYASLIYHFRENGELINVLKAPDGIQFSATRREGARFFAPEFIYMRDGFIEGDNLYVYTSLPGAKKTGDEWEGEPVGLFDKYDLTSGEYVKSIEFPSIPRRALYYNKLVYTANSEGQTFLYHIENDEDF